jgi:dynein heavy chain
MDSTRECYNCQHIYKQKKAICMVGGEGTAKTSTALMFFRTLDASMMLVKRDSTSLRRLLLSCMCQSAIEESVVNIYL